MCSAKVAELMDILGVPDELDGTISMIQGWICSGDDEPQALALRSEEIQLQGFVDTVKTLWNKMKSMSTFIFRRKPWHSLILFKLPNLFTNFN